MRGPAVRAFWELQARAQPVAVDSLLDREWAVAPFWRLLAGLQVDGGWQEQSARLLPRPCAGVPPRLSAWSRQRILGADDSPS